MFDISSDIFISGLQTAAVLSTAAGTFNIDVIFKSKYQAAKIENIDIESASPYVKIKKTDLHGAKKGDSITVLDTVYKLYEFQPGQNIMKIYLSYD